MVVHGLWWFYTVLGPWFVVVRGHFNYRILSFLKIKQSKSRIFLIISFWFKVFLNSREISVQLCVRSTKLESTRYLYNEPSLRH